MKKTDQPKKQDEKFEVKVERGVLHQRVIVSCEDGQKPLYCIGDYEDGKLIRIEICTQYLHCYEQVQELIALLSNMPETT